MIALYATWRLELRRLRQDLVWLLPLLMLLCSLGLWSGWLETQRQQENATLLRQQHQQQLNTQQARVQTRESDLLSEGQPLQPDAVLFRNPARLAQQGSPAMREALPLSWASLGQLPLLPQGFKVSLKAPALLESYDNLQHPLQLWTGYFDLVFVLVYLLPLFLVLISFDLQAREQQDGTLRLLWVQGGQLLPILAGKVLARLSILAGFLGLLTFWSWGLMAVWLQSAWSWPLWICFSLMVFAYGCFWILLAAYLNTLHWSAPQIATGLASLWLLWVWLIPAAGQQMLSQLYPVPSRLDYLQSYREASEAARQQSSQLLGRYLEDHPELAGGADNRYAMLQLSREQALANAIEPLVSQYQQQLNQQQALARWLIWLSPASLTEQTLMHLSGSDLARHQVFESNLQRFQQEWQAFFMPRIAEGLALSSADFEHLPHFIDQPPSTTGPAFGWPLAWLWLSLLGLGAVLRWRWRVYRVI